VLLLAALEDELEELDAPPPAPVVEEPSSVLRSWQPTEKSAPKSAIALRISKRRIKRASRASDAPSSKVPEARDALRGPGRFSDSPSMSSTNHSGGSVPDFHWLPATEAEPSYHARHGESRAVVFKRL